MPRDRLIQFRRGTAAAWASANPTLAAGEPALETDTGILRIGDGTTAWTTLTSTGSQTAKQTSLATNSTLTLVDIPGLAFAVLANRRYRIEFWVSYQTAAITTGIVFNANVPALTSGHWRCELQQGASGTGQYWNVTSATFGATLVGTGVIAADTPYLACLEGFFEPSANGTVQLRFRTEVDTSLVTVNNAGIGVLIDCG